jgi:hypothetical protein
MMRSGVAALAAYAVVTVAITWPLAAAATEKLAGDLGVPLYASWAMARVSTHLTRILGGEIGAFAAMWNGNIFFPEPNALAMSDHFVGQSILTLPVWWATHNPILVYNVAFLASFVLTAFAAFLLTRAWTGSFVAAFFAGLVTVLAPPRLTGDISHLPALSIQWLACALLAARAYVKDGKPWALVALVASIVMCNLSSGSFMPIRAAIIAGYAIVEMTRARKLHDRERWTGLVGAALFALAATIPFLAPYWTIQRALSVDVLQFTYNDKASLALWAAVQAGFGIVILMRWRFGPAIVSVVLVLGLAVVWPTTFPLNRSRPSEGLAAAPAYLEPSPRLPAIYEQVERLSSDAVLIELPFGDPWYDLRYMFFAAVHQRRLANGYGDVLPASFHARRRVLRQPLLDREASTHALIGATHVLVHRRAWQDETGTAITTWIEAIGGHAVATADDAVLYEIATGERLANGGMRR